MDLDKHILTTLNARADGRSPLTISDLARQLGANPFTIAMAARRLVESGLATASMVDSRGVPTLHGLLPIRATVT
ncbi:MAG TPA: winged helix-turn-helix domain-containing protein [Jatrophihabitans sp.]